MNKLIYVFCFTGAVLGIIAFILILQGNNKEAFKLHYEDSGGDDTYAIHTVFIAKENIKYLEQWLDYHILLGFKKFYLYDNSKVKTPGDFDKKNKTLVTGKINKYGFDYNKEVRLSDDQVIEHLEKIKDKYRDNVIHIEWSPIGSDGKIAYAQTDAHADCLKRLKKDGVKWCANIDMDEFIVLKNNETIQQYIGSLNPNISCIRMNQLIFESRDKNNDKLIIDNFNMRQKQPPRSHGCKNIYLVDKTNVADVHTWKGTGKIYKPSKKLSEIFFNHYKCRDTNQSYKQADNIEEEIKHKVYENAKKYIYSE